VRAAPLKIASSVLSEIKFEAECRFPLESGGILLGYRYPSRREPIRVTAQIGPGPKARHECHRFEPDGAWQDAELAHAYECSGQLLTYLGDWHSHPNGPGKPSKLDRRTARAIARCREARLPHPLFLILHGVPGDWALASHQYRWRRLRTTRALVRDCGEEGQ
jgi:integrative and conjugative element protein (TIGR02256 family)